MNQFYIVFNCDHAQELFVKWPYEQDVAIREPSSWDFPSCFFSAGRSLPCFEASWQTSDLTGNTSVDAHIQG